TIELVQIKLGQDLLTEGREQRHCVFTRLGACVDQKTTIWSLKWTHPDGKLFSSRLTLEVRNNELIEARGHCNAMPTNSENKLLQHLSKMQQWSFSPELNYYRM
ncbi:unnamed protein product, partial [Chrysoparadoxa australica]